jgi:hypothetical protein
MTGANLCVQEAAYAVWSQLQSSQPFLSSDALALGEIHILSVFVRDGLLTTGTTEFFSWKWLALA